MTRRRTILAIAALALVAVLVWWGADRLHGQRAEAPGASASHGRTIDSAFTSAIAKTRARSATIPFTTAHGDGEISISGKVVDALGGGPVGNVEVVFRSPAGEETTIAAADGSYRIKVPAGMYRAFVRDDSVLSVGGVSMIRLPGLPSADTVGVPDEALMPAVLASADIDGLDLSVQRGGTVEGRVVDRGGHPIAGAVVRARNGFSRPTLGTDVAETDANGHFELRLPASEYVLEATHPRFAGISGEQFVDIAPGGKQSTQLTMTAGCVIAGRVVDPKGHATGDGAIEKQFGTSEHEFAPAGRIEADGTFRWVTTEEAEISLRAWPWKSPPSEAKKFACRDGVRFDHVVFQLPDRGPDIEGVLVDDKGQGVPFAFIDLTPLDDGLTGQQERTDANGHWQVFAMPAGRYRVAAHAAGHGVVSANVVSPSHDNVLLLGGLGRIEGTTTLLASGSFELEVDSCIEEGTNGTADVIAIGQEHRLVTVTGGRFTIEDMPACQLMGSATWHDQHTPFDVAVPAGGVAHIELALGPPRPKTVHGTVRDDARRPVANVLVTASYNGGTEAVTRTDAAGRYTLRTFSGAEVSATGTDTAGWAEVGMANVDDEEVDLQLGKVDDMEPDGLEPEAPGP